MDFVATYLIHYCNFVISGPNHFYPPGGVRLWGVQYQFLKKKNVLFWCNGNTHSCIFLTRKKFQQPISGLLEPPEIVPRL